MARACEVFPRRWLGPLVAAVAVLGLLPLGAAAPAGAAPDEESCFVVAAHALFLDRDATAGEVRSWTDRFDQGTARSRLPAELANGDEWLTVEVTKLYQQALDRAPDAQGLAFWIGRLRAGALVNEVGSRIYGSPEFYARAGGTDDGFVTDLYARILHRPPDQAGLDHWRGQIAARGRGWVAGRFFASEESRRDRVARLYAQILGRAPDASGHAFWAERLITQNDVRLAVELASGGEFFDRAQQGCVLPPPDLVTFTGHGWGHGRGMGQYGALGYAVDHGWTGAQVLDHFYGGTVAETLPTSPLQRVFLTASQGQELVVTQDAGVLRVDGYGADVAAVRIARLGASSFRVWRGTSCTGPWTLVGDRSAAEVRVASRLAAGDDPARMLQHCVPGRTRYYRGALLAVDAPVRGIVTINEVDTEAMLRSIVPAEMPASWADLGGGQGGAALRAQAVAARSYALAGDTRWGSWATTCDSTTCQVYAGYGSRLTGAATPTKAEFTQSDTAVLATARQIRRRTSTGLIARTEFSSSTGGWTAGGDFPAVVDDGDDISGNTRHTWTKVVPAVDVEAAMDGREGRDMGPLLGFDSYVRNGLGDMGGRVLSVRVRFTGGDVTLTGEQLRSLLGLNSNWYTTS